MLFLNIIINIIIIHIFHHHHHHNSRMKYLTVMQSGLFIHAVSQLLKFPIQLIILDLKAAHLVVMMMIIIMIMT